MPFLFICDLAAPYLLLGQAFGRFGNFMNGDAHGTPTDLAWGMVFRYGPASQEFPNQALHPVMLYELFLNIIGFLVLFFLRKKRFREGYFLQVVYLLRWVIGGSFWLYLALGVKNALPFDFDLAAPYSYLTALQFGKFGVSA